MFSKLKKVLSVFLYIMLFLIFVFTLTLFGPAMKRTHDVEQKLSEQNALLEKRKTTRTALLREVHDLERNPEAIERVARERFNMCKDGEIIIKYDR